MMQPACVFCSGALDEVAGFGDLRRVTSDCRAWPSGGRLAVCAACGAVQKPADEKFLSEIERIYASYRIYHQSAGSEQRVYAGGEGRPRSLELLRHAFAQADLPDRGRMLDVGCGNGALLKSFAQLKPGWTLAGTELSDAYREAVESVPGIEALYVGEIESVPGRFGFITMLHSLEHFTDPVGILGRIRGKLADGGLLLIEVPDFRQNPFDLLIADHALHFSPGAIRRALSRAGYEIVCFAQDWIAKEISVLARPVASSSAAVAAEPDNRAAAGHALSLLRDMAEEAAGLAQAGSLGIFGTSIAGTWLAAELEEAGQKPAFFIDEDRGRVARDYLGVPVLSPAVAPDSTLIYVPLAPAVARDVAKRLGAERYRVPRAYGVLDH